MQKENIEAIMWQYLQGDLPVDKKIEFEVLLSEDEILFKEFELTKKIYDEMSKVVVPAPSINMQNRFNQMLSVHTENSISTNKTLKYIKSIIASFTLSKYAFPALCLVLGFVMGVATLNIDQGLVFGKNAEVKRLSNEVSNMKQMMMLAMLQNPIATERMKAVSYTKEFEKIDDRVMNALITTFQSDDDDNVRLLALKALLKQADKPEVREMLIESLMVEKSPIIQVALADAMIKLQEKKSVTPLKKRLKETELNKFVKEKFENTIDLLEL
jgi:hypothetical protein